jgi:hypothetical protein
VPPQQGGGRIATEEGDTALPITDEQVAHWLEHGYVLIPDFLDAQQLDAARAVAYRYFPTAAEYYDTPHRYLNIPFHFEFPFRDDALNNLSTGPDLVDAARRIIGTEDVFLTQSLLWAKYAGRGDWEQEHHVDYQNNSLLYPSDEPGFRQMPSILYLEDVTLDMGPTVVVSRTVTRGHAMAPPITVREEVGHFYEAETPVVVKAGTMMLYDMHTFHRGSRLLATEGIRLTYHNVFRGAGLEWMGWRSWPHEGLQPEMVRFVEQATVEQLTVIGFPKPGHAYWNQRTLDGVALRYPGLDMAEYREAVARRDAAAARETVGTPA